MLKNNLIKFFIDVPTLDMLLRCIAVISFGLGTLLFGSFMITSKEILVAIGFVYVEVALVTNLIVFAICLVFILRRYWRKESTWEQWKSLLTLLSNIPIALLYFFIVIKIGQKFF
jgi:uncharacterized membrane protein